jgi:hypothetical protein
VEGSAARLAEAISVQIIQFLVGILAGGLLGAMTFIMVIHREWSDSVTGLATIALTLVTAALVGYTASLANDARKATELTDRHHQESLNPYLVLESIRFFELPAKDSRGAQIYNLRLEARLRNVGLASAPSAEYQAKISGSGKSFDYPDAGAYKQLGAITLSEIDTVLSFLIDPKSGIVRESDVRGMSSRSSLYQYL